MKKFVGICFLVAFTVIMAPSIMAAQEAPVPRSLVRIHLDTRAELYQVAEIGLLSVCGYSRGPGYVDVVVLPYELNTLRANQLRLTVMEENIDDRLEKYRRAQDQGIYHSVAQMGTELQQIHETYPELTTLESIGQSWEERPIWALKISDNPLEDEDEPAILYYGAHHAREWISFEVPLALAHFLLSNYGSNEEITGLVNEREIWIVPIVNPDGVVHSQTEYTMWRKNRRKYEQNPTRWWGSGSKDGVDLNRNYSYMWGNVGASSSPSSDTYHGTEPFSEPEIIALKELTIREQFDAALGFHSYSELVLYPFGYDYDAHAPDEPVLKELAEGMAAFTGYTPQKITDLYACMGTSDDWFYGEMGVFAFTIELGTWFIPDDDEVGPICETNIESCMFLLERTGNLVEERVRTIVDIQRYIGAVLKDASNSERSLTTGEQREYMRMIKLRNKLSDHLVREVLAGEGSEKLAVFAGTLRNLKSGIRPVFRSAVKDIAAALKNRNTELPAETQLILRELLEN